MSKKPYFCDECSTRNTPDSKFCKECGAQIHDAYQSQALTEYDRIDDPTDQERLSQFIDMAFWHTEAGNTEAAIRACLAALALNANSTTAHSLLGSLYEKQGDDAQAITHFERVLALNPDSAADRIKLQELQEGVHTQPVRASPVYRWLPPAFGTAQFSSFAQNLREKWEDMPRPEMSGLPVKNTPALAAGAALVLVLAAGLFLLKPSSTNAPKTAPQPQALVSPGFNSQIASALPSSAPALPPPLVMMPTTSGTPLAPAPSVVASVPPTDPFAGNIPTPLSKQQFDAQTHQRDATGHIRSSEAGGLSPLPPLIAVPRASDGPLPPAPVSVPQNVGADGSVSPNANIPHYTVVVRHLKGLQEFAAPAASGTETTPASQDTEPNMSVEPPARIQITVDPSTDSNSSDSNSGFASPSTGSGSAAVGESAQQSAFALQQQGNYHQAASDYQKAINAYQAQISAGNDRDAATRGLQACQTGLEICRQNL